jgi:hypothetical protein
MPLATLLAPWRLQNPEVPVGLLCIISTAVDAWRVSKTGVPNAPVSPAVPHLLEGTERSVPGRRSPGRPSCRTLAHERCYCDGTRESGTFTTAECAHLTAISFISYA